MKATTTNVGLNRWIPRRLVSYLARLMYQTRLSRILIAPYIRRYGVRMEEFVRPVKDYASLVDFFCREINPALRPVAQGSHILVAPVDGRIAEYGTVKNGRMIQAKGMNYSPARLLGGDNIARHYEGGLYIAIYLSPADYHRIHAPVSGSVHRATRIRGTRWPVNEHGVRGVEHLFEKNERVITYLDTQEFGQVAMVKVGAYIVGRVVVTYESQMGALSGRQQIKTVESADGITVCKGDELGRFEFGSTVILLIEPGSYRWSTAVEYGAKVKMGQPILERA